MFDCVLCHFLLLERYKERNRQAFWPHLTCGYFFLEIYRLTVRMGGALESFGQFLSTLLAVARLPCRIKSSAILRAIAFPWAALCCLGSLAAFRPFVRVRRAQLASLIIW